MPARICKRLVQPLHCPLVSRRIASQKLSHVPVAKRGEGLLMCRFGLDTDAPPAALVDGKKAYDAG